MGTGFLNKHRITMWRLHMPIRPHDFYDDLTLDRGASQVANFRPDGGLAESNNIFCLRVRVCVCVLQFLLLNSLLTAASQLGRGPDYLNHVEMACGASMRACGETLTNDWQHKKK